MHELWLTFPTIKIPFFPALKNCPVLTKHPWITSYTNDIPNDQSGNRYLTAEERAREAEAIADQERLAKQEAEQKAQRLAARLRSLGINPDVGD